MAANNSNLDTEIVFLIGPPDHNRRSKGVSEPLMNAAEVAAVDIKSSVCMRQAEFLRAMNTMRNLNELCDVELIAEGQVTYVHRVVMAACSSFFHAMFTTKMNEARASKVNLKDVSMQTLQHIIDFAYTADISITDTNVQELLSAANQYQINPIKEACCDYLKSQLSATNCLGIRDFAEFHSCNVLYEAACTYVDRHFQEVCNGEEFLHLGKGSLLALLQRDQLTVRCEDEVYDSAVRWLKHEVTERAQYKQEILSSIRFPQISKTYLTNVVEQEPLLQDSCECLRMVIAGLRYHVMSAEERRQSNLHNLKPRRKKYDYRVAVLGGSEENTCQYFNCKDQSWHSFEPMPEKRRDHVVAQVGPNIYVLGGSSLFLHARIDSYNIINNQWSVMDSRLELGRDCAAACTMNNKIYISGGTKSKAGTNALACVQCYDPAIDQLFPLPPLSRPRFDHGMVVHGDCLYVCGGACNTPSANEMKSCEKFLPQYNRWSSVPSLKSARRGLGLCVVGDKIYALGGQDEQGQAQDTIECYDPVKVSWSYKANMPYKLRSVKCAVVDDSIWVLAGLKDVGRLTNVIEYRVKEDIWQFHHSVNAFQMGNAAALTIDMCTSE